MQLPGLKQELVAAISKQRNPGGLLLGVEAPNDDA